MDSTISAPLPSCAGFTSSGFFLAAMMPLSDGQPRARDAFVDREHGGQRERDGLGGALEIAPRGAPSFAELQMGDGGDAGKAEQLGVIGPTVPLAVSVAIRPKRIRS